MVKSCFAPKRADHCEALTSQSEILMHFVKDLILASLPTMIDLGTDSISAEKFIVGANYTGWVSNLSEIENKKQMLTS